MLWVWSEVTMSAFLDNTVAQVQVEASVEAVLGCVAFSIQRFTELVTMVPGLDCVESFKRLANQVGHKTVIARVTRVFWQ